MLGLMAGLSVAQAPVQGTSGPNAALVYWRAFSLIPDMTKAEEEMLVASTATPVGAKRMRSRPSGTGHCGCSTRARQ